MVQKLEEYREGRAVMIQLIDDFTPEEVKLAPHSQMQLALNDGIKSLLFEFSEKSGDVSQFLDKTKEFESRRPLLESYLKDYYDMKV